MAQSIFVTYKSVFRFIAVFVGTYIALSLLYSGYLYLSKDGSYRPDYITHLVAQHSNALVEGWGYDSNLIPDKSLPMLQMHVNGTYVGRIIEGCNALSIMILFVSFVISFWQGTKKTLIFILAGTALIYAINVLRIAILAIALYHYPEKESLLHGTLFPAVIYSLVFLLWVAWIRSIKKPISNE
ncbi:MAG: exosortase family protein XrtF [Gilvibacter sp.]